VTERYMATSASGERVVRTDSPSTAAGYAAKLRGRVIDTFAAASKRLIDGIAQEIGEGHPNALSRLDILDGVGGQR
jgi:hypothetical protein